jgi:hypothetical protein
MKLTVKNIESSSNIFQFIYSSSFSAQSINFSKPNITTKNNATKTLHLIKSKLPVNAKTLKIYDIEAPIPPATYRFLRDIL